MKQKIDELVKKLNLANNLYRLGEPSGMTDKEFDLALKELKALEDANPRYRRDDSPTLRIGIEPLTGLKRVKHSEPMLSIENVYSIEELEKWFAQYPNNMLYSLEHKVDGVALSLIYENNVLVEALTRGDGVNGDSVLHNAKTIAGIFPYIKPLPPKFGWQLPERFVLRGEVYLPVEAFQKWNAQHGDRYANPRNAAAGAIRLLNPAECAKRPLRFVAHSASSVQCTTREQSWFNLLMTALGFETAAYPWKDGASAHTATEILSFLKTSYGTEKEKRTVVRDFETDGLVIKIDRYQYRQEVGSTATAPKWQVALKVENYSAQTVLKAVDWQVGKTGILTPVARFEPVEIDGTSVSNATLHNLDIIKELGLKIGDTIIVKKAGKIIPAVESVVSHAKGKQSKEIVPPEVCPVCGGPVVTEGYVMTVYCIGNNCSAQTLGKILFYAGRTAVDIVGLGEQMIEALIENCGVSNFADLYMLEEEDFLKLPRVGKALATKCVKAIQTKKNPPLDKFLIGLAIPYCGEGTAKRLTKVYASLSEIEQASVADLLKIDDIGGRTAESIHTFFRSDYWPDVKAKLVRYAVVVADMPKAKKADFQPLAGKTIVVTGTLSKYKRTEIEGIIEKYGGKASGSVSKKTDYVLAGVDAGSKLTKAQSLGVPIISEEQFDDMLIPL